MEKHPISNNFVKNKDVYMEDISNYMVNRVSYEQPYLDAKLTVVNPCYRKFCNPYKEIFQQLYSADGAENPCEQKKCNDYELIMVTYMKGFSDGKKLHPTNIIIN